MSGVEWIDGLRDYAGAIHVHTAYSDSYGRMPYIVRSAREAGLDFVVTADHNSLDAAAEGWQGWHDGVLLIIGVEVSSKRGHSVVLGLESCPRWRKADPNDYLPEVADLGGKAILAHPERTFRGKHPRQRPVWGGLVTDDYAGAEVWSYGHDWMSRAFPWRMIRGLRDPDSLVRGPHPEVLRQWDEVAQRRRVAGVGALDSHERRVGMIGRWSMLRVMPMGFWFRTLRTHVLMEECSGQGGPDAAALTRAICGGRCFISRDILADGRGTRFFATNADAANTGASGDAAASGGAAVMGDEVAAGGEWEFVAAVPQDAHISLVRNGEVIAETDGRRLVHRDSRPGAYRIEARLDDKPWIFTNHIYVRSTL